MLLIYAGIKLCDFGLFGTCIYHKIKYHASIYSTTVLHCYIGYIPPWYEFLKVSVSGKDEVI